MSIIFISDIHLSSDKPHLTDFFKSFIGQCCETATHIYILGDLFDLWLGDDDESHFAKEVKATLKKATDKGINLFFQKGNKIRCFVCTNRYFFEHFKFIFYNFIRYD